MMKRAFRKSVILSLGLVLCLQTSLAQVGYSFIEGEEWFPDKSEWTYHYTYRIPQIAGEDDLSQELNYYFDGALGEMTKLVLPMYAGDAIMAGQGANEVSDDYRVTCNNGSFFSVLVHHRQSMDEQTLYSLSSVVFAASGAYRGESLTLRGLAGEIGESSEQLAALVILDVWRQISQQTKSSDTDIKKDFSFETLTEEFFPETHFYANEGGDIVFYLQPGVLRQDDEPVYYIYTAQELEALLI